MLRSYSKQSPRNSSVDDEFSAIPQVNASSMRHIWWHVLAALRSMDGPSRARSERQAHAAVALVRKTVVAARTGWADTVLTGQFLKIVDPNGKQAGDFWACNASNPDEHLSAMHTRVWVNRLCPRPGESFHTNHRRPILQLVQDTCGVHDLLTAPCDEHRYRLYGVQGEHAGY
jgi:uncharacterized protein YcgI (DUF1989 family)